MPFAKLAKITNTFLDSTVDGAFETDEQGRTIFYPLSFGTGRIVADARRAATLRVLMRRMQIFTFAILVPAIGLAAGVFQFRAWALIAFLLVCTALGLAQSLIMRWQVRDLPFSDRRRVPWRVSPGPLDSASDGFLRFGVVTSAVFTLTGIGMLAASGATDLADPVGGAIATIFFGPLTVLYARAIKSRRERRDTAGT